MHAVTVEPVAVPVARDRRPLFQLPLRALLVLPAIVVVVAALVYPLLTIVARSFTEPSPGVSNYLWFFSSPINVTILLRTFQVAAWVTLICILVAYPYAFLMTVVGPRLRTLMFLCVLVPFWVSGVVRTLAWMILLQNSGPINQLLIGMGLEPVRLIRTPLGVTIAMVQVLLPFMIMPLYAVLKGIDLRLVVAARSLGASPLRAFLTVYLPLSLPGVFAGGLIVAILALGFYLTPALLGGPASTMLSTLVEQQVLHMLNWGKGSAMGVVLLVLTLVLLAVGRPLARTKYQLSGGSK